MKCNSMCVTSRLWCIALLTLLVVQPITVLQANDLPVAMSARQSLLFEVSGVELRLLRRVVPEVSQGSSANALDGLIAPTTFQDSNFAGVPHAQWLDSDGRVIALTSFEDPRVLRSPQTGNRTHGAIVAQPVSHFLLRGPGSAVTVNMYLPALEMGAAQVLPFDTSRASPGITETFSTLKDDVRVSRSQTGVQADIPTSDSASQSVAQPQQSWRIDLSL